ncbi:MAG: alpha/beta hydrolase [Acidimicrobiia bacterium]|nr:alpha/beta hydrolase [Acidimicrobiia bacterium]
MTQPLDAELEAAVGAFPQFTMTVDLLPAFRQPAPPAELSTAVERTDRQVPGDPPVAVRVHRPADATGPLPCFVSMHGGGFVIGSVDMDDLLFDRWCPLLGVVGVSVDFRLAPETPYPGPLDDCYRALVWTYEHADELGVHRDAIVLHGVSAGGGLAAGLALLARDRGEVPVALQILDTPMLDDRRVTASSRQDGLAIWNRESNEFGWRSYLGDRFDTDDVPAYAAPTRATDLAGLPPAFVSVGSCDGFRDEDVEYALRLNQAGVPAELHVYAGAPHGYQFARETAVYRASRLEIEDWFVRQRRPVNGGAT